MSHISQSKKTFFLSLKNYSAVRKKSLKSKFLDKQERYFCPRFSSLGSSLKSPR